MHVWSDLLAEYNSSGFLIDLEYVHPISSFFQNPFIIEKSMLFIYDFTNC